MEAMQENMHSDLEDGGEVRSRPQTWGKACKGGFLLSLLWMWGAIAALTVMWLHRDLLPDSIFSTVMGGVTSAPIAKQAWVAAAVATTAGLESPRPARPQARSPVVRAGWQTAGGRAANASKPARARGPVPAPAPAPAPARPGIPTVAGAVQRGCYRKDAQRIGKDLEQPMPEADAMECQRRCAVVVGCAHWSFGPDKLCKIFDAQAWERKRSGHMSGPPWCQDNSGAGDKSRILRLPEVDRRLKMGCLRQDVRYGGTDLQKCTMEVTALECQARCSFVQGCAHFTFFPGGKCCLRDTNANEGHVAGAISGPARCTGKAATPLKLPRCPVDLGPIEKAVPQNPSVDSCVAAFPAYKTYLDRVFGQHRTLDPMPKAERQQVKENMKTSTRAFKVTPSKTVDLEVRSVIDSGSRAPTVTLKAYPNKTVGVEFPDMGRCPQIGHKLCGLKSLLRGVIRRRGERLYKDLEQLGGTVSMLWRGADADFPSNPKLEKSKYPGGLPLHGYSSDPGNYDIAMPDFTFMDYPEIRSHLYNRSWHSNAWEKVRDRLNAVRRKTDGFVFRGKANWRGTRKNMENLIKGGPPAYVRRLLKDFAPDGFDVAVTLYTPLNQLPAAFLSLYDQCKFAHTFHVSGTHYSAMLKYKLACGQTVFILGDVSEEEFWYDALKDGENVFFIRNERFWEDLHKALMPSVDPPLSSKERAACVAARARRLTETYLSQTGIDCYFMMYLQRYYLPFLKRALKNRK